MTLWLAVTLSPGAASRRHASLGPPPRAGGAGFADQLNFVHYFDYYDYDSYGLDKVCDLSGGQSPLMGQGRPPKRRRPCGSPTTSSVALKSLAMAAQGLTQVLSCSF